MFVLQVEFFDNFRRDFIETPDANAIEIFAEP